MGSLGAGAHLPPEQGPPPTATLRPPQLPAACWAHILLPRPPCLYSALSPDCLHPFFMPSLLHLLGSVAQNAQGGLGFLVFSGAVSPRPWAPQQPGLIWQGWADPGPRLLCRSPPLPPTLPVPHPPSGLRSPDLAQSGCVPTGPPSPLLTFCIPLSPQGIERLKRKHQPRERRGSWKSVKETFGGDFSLNWFNPFSGPCDPEPLSDRDWVRQAASLSETDNTETTEEQSEERKDEDSVEVTDE